MSSLLPGSPALAASEAPHVSRDTLIKSQAVAPAEAGTQGSQALLDPRLREDDLNQRSPRGSHPSLRRSSHAQLPFRDLSYRFKIPFSVSVVILVTALIVSAVLIVRSYQYLRADLIASAESLGKTLSRALTPALLRDEMWQAYETIITPFDAPRELESDRKVVVVVNTNQQVYVSSHPRLFRSLTPLAEVSKSYGELAAIAAKSASEAPFVAEDVLPSHIVVAVPVLSEDGIRLGTVLLIYAESLFLPRFWETVQQVLLSTLAVLAVLIPLGWYAGNRMVIPLLDLAHAMRRVGSEPPSQVRADLYLGGDEIGQLGRQFQTMLHELENKQALERQMIMSDRLASIGRLTAGIAHEINNPLGGMLNAINTCRKHGSVDPVTARTIRLLERGCCRSRKRSPHCWSRRGSRATRSRARTWRTCTRWWRTRPPRNGSRCVGTTGWRVWCRSRPRWCDKCSSTCCSTPSKPRPRADW